MKSQSKENFGELTIQTRYGNLRKLARYGLGCAIFSLKNKREFQTYLQFVKGEDEKKGTRKGTGIKNGIQDGIEKIERIIYKALPNAYPIALPNCRNYFLGRHNMEVRARNEIGAGTEAAARMKRFCLAEIGRIIEIKKLEELKTVEKQSIGFILRSPLVEPTSRFGVVRYEEQDGQTNENKEKLEQPKEIKEIALLDVLPEHAEIGDFVVIHRNIACDKL